MSATNRYETPIHNEEIAFFTRLLIDLKKREVGHAYEAITMERLEEGTRHVQTLFQCKKKGLFR
jgi:hypothetical protein